MKRFQLLLGVAILLVIAGCSNPVSSDSDGDGDGTAQWQPPAFDWSFVDGASSQGLNVGITTNAYAPSAAVLSGEVYTAWVEGIPDRQVRVALFNGDNASPSWEQLDEDNWNQEASGDASRPHLTAFNSKLYVFWHEQSSLRGAVYDGDPGSPAPTNITGAGINIDSNSSTGAVSSAVLDGKLYLLYVEEDTDPDPHEYRLRAVRYNGNDASPTWTAADAGFLNDVDGERPSSPHLIGHNGKLYAFWHENSAEVGNNNYFLQAAVYNGDDGNPDWSAVDGGSVEPAPTANPESALAEAVSFEDRLYLFWSGGNNYKIRAAVYNDNDAAPQWDSIDGGSSSGLNYDSSQSANSVVDTVVTGSTLYVTWSEANPSSVDQLRVAAFNGDPNAPQWAFVDGAGVDGLNFDPDTYNAVDPEIVAVNENTLYLTWQERSGASNIRIRARTGERTN